MDKFCSQHEDMMTTVRDIHGDIKVLVSEFKAMNGALRTTKQDFEAHGNESKEYRKKIDVIWSMIHTLKYAVILLFGTGILWKIMEYINK